MGEEAMTDDKILEKYARAQTSGTKPTFVRDVFRHLLARLDASEARAAAAERERDELRAAQQWQPIETAPHEELVLLGWVQEWPDRRWKMELGLASAGERLSNGYSNRWQHAHATHWMPSPAPLGAPLA